jgi:hypothetical protein
VGLGCSTPTFPSEEAYGSPTHQRPSVSSGSGARVGFRPRSAATSSFRGTTPREEPWVDGTVAGTKRLVDWVRGAVVGRQSFATIGTKAYFVSQWTVGTDGTPQNAWSWKTGSKVVAAGQNSSCRGTLIAPSRRTPLVSDGTAGGRSTATGSRRNAADTRLSRSPEVFFPCSTERFGDELWATDGLGVPRYRTIDGGERLRSRRGRRAHFMSRAGIWSTDGTGSAHAG